FALSLRRPRRCARRPPRGRRSPSMRQRSRAGGLLAVIEAVEAGARRAGLADRRALVGRRVRTAEAHRGLVRDRAAVAARLALDGPIAEVLIERPAADLPRRAIRAVA